MPAAGQGPARRLPVAPRRLHAPEVTFLTRTLALASVSIRCIATEAASRDGGGEDLVPRQRMHNRHPFGAWKSMSYPIRRLAFLRAARCGSASSCRAGDGSLFGRRCHEVRVAPLLTTPAARHLGCTGLVAPMLKPGIVVPGLSRTRALNDP